MGLIVRCLIMLFYVMMFFCLSDLQRTNNKLRAQIQANTTEYFANIAEIHRNCEKDKVENYWDGYQTCVATKCKGIK